VTSEVIHLRDFPPFIRFELTASFRRKVFSHFTDRVGQLDVDISPVDFWRAAETEFGTSRYELIMGSLRGGIIKKLDERPLTTKTILKSTPHFSPYSVYHALIWLREHGLVEKRADEWAIRADYFARVHVADLARVHDLRHEGLRRKNALSMKDLETAIYLWPWYEHKAERDARHIEVSAYGRSYENHFSLARAVKAWEKGAINIPQWALIAITDLTGHDVEEQGAIASYSLPPGVRIVPYYKNRYKIPLELSPDFDVIALRILLKCSEDGVIHPRKYRKMVFKNLYHTFGLFHSTRIPLSIREIIAHHYRVPPGDKASFRIPTRMRARWESLPQLEHELAQILVLEMLFELDKPRRTYELISRSEGFLKDVALLVKELGLGELRIHKRRDRPHYRTYLPKSVKENLERLKEDTERFKIERGAEFLSEEARIELFKRVKDRWGERGVNIIANLSMAAGVRDLDLARAAGVTPKEVRKLLYEFKDHGLVTDVREETSTLVEYYYYLSAAGITKFLATKPSVEQARREEELTYPFPEEFSYYQRRRIFSEAVK
jgi:DNA-binding HxlR family transcriptional regulator